tara:strand:+ start:4601 stop:4840 length:240 start_codon:yes stop_codon:yes gene_type:complete
MKKVQLRLHQQHRHKKIMIKEIVTEKKEWVAQYDDYPYEYWKRRWDYLCRRLNKYVDMERQLRHSNTRYVHLEEKSKHV